MKIKDTIIYTVIFMLIFSFIFIFILAVINQFTKTKIEKNKEIFERKAILNAFYINYSSDEDAFDKYERKIKTVKVDNTELFKYTDENQNILYANIFSGPGLWGTITGILAVNDDVTRIIGIDFVSHNETPGLGARIEEEWYKKQFKNEKIIDNKISSKTGNGDYNSENSIVDTITGATNTSQLLEKSINDNINKLKKIIQQDKKNEIE